MEDRLKKFKEGRMDVEELSLFKSEIESLTDDELDSLIDKAGSDVVFSQSDITNIQKKLNKEINSNRRRTVFYRLFAGCAAVLIPVIIVCGYIIFNKNKTIQLYDSIISRQIVIETVRGEYMTTVLPDGSRVYMGPESSLSYSIAAFGPEERHVLYSGEGNFSIAKIPNSSFVLSAPDFKIKVLGTEFSILSRKDKENSEIYLDKGSIQLISLDSDYRRIMNPGETATISRATGDMKIYDANSNFRRTVGQAIMYFSSSPLTDVASKMELYYGYDVIVNDNLKDVSFTGSLPTDNIWQATFILENTLNIKFTKDDTCKRFFIE